MHEDGTSSFVTLVQYNGGYARATMYPGQTCFLVTVAAIVTHSRSGENILYQAA